MQRESVVMCEKNFYHFAERTQLVLAPGTLERRAEVQTTGEFDDWLGSQKVPYDLEMAVEGDEVVLTGGCALRVSLR